MTIRSLAVALLLAATMFACEQKMAPETGADDTTEGAATTPASAASDGGADAKDGGAAPAPVATTKPDAATTDDTTKGTTPPPGADGKDAKDTDPKDVGACVAECKDPVCLSKCFGGFGPGAPPFGGK